MGLLKLPTDKALVEDPKFRPYIEIYAKVKMVMLKALNLLLLSC